MGIPQYVPMDPNTLALLGVLLWAAHITLGAWTVAVVHIILYRLKARQEWVNPDKEELWQKN